MKILAQLIGWLIVIGFIFVLVMHFLNTNWVW